MHNACRLLSFVMMLFVMMACNRSDNSQVDTSSQKFQRYYLQGKQLYTKHCSNCHQENGTGLGRVYPPLNKSDFMNQRPGEVICLIRYGRTGEVMVNGVAFNQKMPASSSLTDLEIAEIATYIYNTWEHRKGIIEVGNVSNALDSCKNVPL